MRIIEQLKKEVEVWNASAKETECSHSSYWTTVYDHCMACRAEKAEAQLAQAHADMKVEAAKLKQATRDYDEEYKIVERLWNMLGGQTDQKESIYDKVAQLITRTEGT